jgi:hypothetical protein
MGAAEYALIYRQQSAVHVLSIYPPLSGEQRVGYRAGRSESLRVLHRQRARQPPTLVS